MALGQLAPSPNGRFISSFIRCIAVNASGEPVRGHRNRRRHHGLRAPSITIIGWIMSASIGNVQFYHLLRRHRGTTSTTTNHPNKIHENILSHRSQSGDVIVNTRNRPNWRARSPWDTIAMNRPRILSGDLRAHRAISGSARRRPLLDARRDNDENA